MKMASLIKVCLNETYSRVRVGKLLSDTFPVKNCLKRGYALTPLLFLFAKYEFRRVQVKQYGLKLNATTSSWIVLIMLTYWVEPYILSGNTQRGRPVVCAK
jgi:hypothetical protein